MVAEPQSETSPVVAKPRSETSPVVAEPRSETSPVVTEPWSETSPVVAEPRSETSPVVAEPRSETSPVVAEPRSETSPVVAERRSETSPVVAESRVCLRCALRTCVRRRTTSRPSSIGCARTTCSGRTRWSRGPTPRTSSSSSRRSPAACSRSVQGRSVGEPRWLASSWSARGYADPNVRASNPGLDRLRVAAVRKSLPAGQIWPAAHFRVARVAVSSKKN